MCQGYILNSTCAQWFRISLILVLAYWLASWGESMMAPNKHFDPMASSDAELNDFKVLDNLTETAAVAMIAKIDKNISVAADIQALDKNITSTVEGDEAIVVKTVTDDASEMWLGKKDDLDSVTKVADFPEIQDAMPERAVSPTQQVFSFIKNLITFVWVVLVILLRAHTRKRFDIAAKVYIRL